MIAVSPFTGRIFTRNLPARLRESLKSEVQSQKPVRLQTSDLRLQTELTRIIRRQALGNWMLPSLASVTPQYIETILRGALGGNHVQQWELFDLMIDTWPRLLKNTGELTGAVEQMDWKLEAWAEDDQPPSAAALERKKLISDAVWRMRPAADTDDNGFEQTIADLASAWWTGLTVLEVIWESRRVGQLGDLTVPNCTYWVHPRNYAWSDEGFLGLNATQENSPGIFAQRQTNIVRFPENKFLVAICKAKSGPPLTSARLRALAWWWCAANFSADWLMNRAQLFGIPFRWATTAQNADDATVVAVGDMLANMGSSGYGSFPEGTNLNFLEAGQNAGQSPQADLIERADKNCDLLLLGQTLTSDTGGSGAGGGSLALGKVHSGVRDQIIQSVANFVARVLNQQLIPAILRENYGDTEEAPYFCPEPEEQEDEKANADRDAVLLTNGVELPKKWFYERHNVPLPQPGEEVIGAPAPAPLGVPPAGGSGSPGMPPKDGTPNPELQTSDFRPQTSSLSAARAGANLTPEERYLAEVASKIDPVATILNRIANIADDAQMMAALQQFYSQADSVVAVVTADVTRQARALEQLTAPAFVKGLRGK